MFIWPYSEYKNVIFDKLGSIHTLISFCMVDGCSYASLLNKKTSFGSNSNSCHANLKSQKNNNINKMATPKQTTSHVQRVRESGKTAHKRNIHTNCTKKQK